MSGRPKTKLQRHRAKQKEAGVVRFSIQLGGDAVRTLRDKCLKHHKTQREFLEMAILAADALLAGRLQVPATTKTKPAHVIIRKGPESAQKPSAYTEISTTTKNPLQDALSEPADEADALIRVAAFVVEP